MYFSKGKTQSAQTSMTDLGNPNPPSRPQSAVQKNLFNFNIYFSDRNQGSVAAAGGSASSSASQGATTTQVAQQQSQQQTQQTQQSQNTAGITLSYQNQVSSQQANNISLHQYQGAVSSSSASSSNQNQYHLHRQLKSSNNRDGEQGGARILMQHSTHKFKPLTVPMAIPKQLNGSQSVSNLGLQQNQQFGFGSSSQYHNNSSRRSVTKIRLVGYSGDPEFQMVKDTSYKIVQANEGMLVVNMDEIDNEIDYDIKLKQLKRSSSAFLPAYKAFKNSSNSNNNNNAHNNNINNLTINNNSSILSQVTAIQNQLNNVQSAANFKRPFYFLTEKNEPIFSLKQLQEKYPMKHQAQQIIELHEEQQTQAKIQLHRNPSLTNTGTDFNSTSQSGFPSNQVEFGRLHTNNANGNGYLSASIPSYSSFTTLSSTQPTSRTGLPTQAASHNFIIDDMGEKKHVYLTIRTAQKFFHRDSTMQFFSFFPSDVNGQSAPQQNKPPSQHGSSHNLQNPNKQQNGTQDSSNSTQQNNSSSQTTVQNENANNSNQNTPWQSNQATLYNNGEPFKIIIELYTKIAPKACENFIKLCEGFINNDGNYLTFRNTQALRVKKNGFIQMGYSKPGVSIYNGYFEDESFAVQHDKPGIIGYCNRGVPHSNSSQFYITLGEMKSFDKKMVAFGRVICGFKHLEKLNKMMLNTATEIPPFNINICDSGVVLNRPSTNQSRKSTSSNVSGVRSPKGGRNDPLQFGDADHVIDDDSYRVVRPDIFSYKGEKPTKFQTYEQYVIQESEKHKEVANTEYISLMLAFQSIAFTCQDIMNYSFTYKSIDAIRGAMKNAFVTHLSDCQSVALLYDTKDDEIFIESNYGKFVVAFTSLDVDHLCDLTNCGSLFVIYRKTTTTFRPAKRTDLLQSGENIYGAGYIMYGQSTQIVFHTGHRLNGYTYDPENNIFILTHPRIKSSKKGGIISCDESVIHMSDENISKFIKRKKISKESYVTRYVGSRVADFHRTLLYGGILIYPQKKVNIFEAFTLSYIIDKAWDRSSCGQDGQVLIKKPNELTDQIQLYIGFSQDVLEIDNLYLSIRRKNSLYKIHDLPSSKTIKSSAYSVHKSSLASPTKNQQHMLLQ